MIKKIKILYLTTSCQMAGTEKMLYELTGRIDKEKFEVLVCTIKSGDGDLLSKLKEKGIQTKTLNLNSKWQFFKTLKLIKIIRNFKPDIFQSFLFFDNILARVFGRLCKVPIIISGIRNVEIYRSFWRNFLDKITLPFADFVISNTQAGKKFLSEKERIPLNKIFVIPNGIDLTKVPPPLTKEQKTHLLKEILPTTNYLLPTNIIGFVGYLTKQKGVTYLLQAFSQLKEEIRERTLLLIIGDGPIKNDLENLAGKLKIKNRVHFLGHKKEAINYMPLFDIFCLPSLWEGQPNVILEAMALGLPIIGSRVGGVPEVIENKKNGILVSPADPKALSEAIEFLLKDKEEREKIAQNALNSVKRYDIKIMVENYENLYQRLAK